MTSHKIHISEVPHDQEGINLITNHCLGLEFDIKPFTREELKKWLSPFVVHHPESVAFTLGVYDRFYDKPKDKIELKDVIKTANDFDNDISIRLVGIIK